MRYRSARLNIIDDFLTADSPAAAAVMGASNADAPPKRRSAAPRTTWRLTASPSATGTFYITSAQPPTEQAEQKHEFVAPVRADDSAARRLDDKREPEPTPVYDAWMAEWQARHNGRRPGDPVPPANGPTAPRVVTPTRVILGGEWCAA